MPDELSESARTVLEKLSHEQWDRLDLPVPICAGTLTREFTPEQVRGFKAAWAESMRNAAQVPIEVVPVDTVQKQVEILVANLPVESAGLLIVKLRGDNTTEEAMTCTGRAVRDAVIVAGLSLIVLVLAETDSQPIDLQLLTNTQLRAIGFERVEPKPDYLNITRDAV
jgi:hypothetical protein